ncbi:MAG TPA: PspC domain-containing protein [Candidatus Sulfomarinibacteraceae bacterium]|nr:PspC domain-containing protein [Candidatus Sulfomarinibacteraceae bacterium]
MSEKRLVRSRTDRMFFGVAGGVAHYLNVDPVLVRLIFVLIALASQGQILLVYLILAILMPEEKGRAKANPFDEDEIVIKDNA